MADTKTSAAARQSSIGVSFTIKATEDKEYSTGNPATSELTSLAPAVSDIPDLGANPEQIDVTTIGMSKRAYIKGIKDPGELEFTCFYTENDYDVLRKVQQNGTIVDATIALKDGLSIKITGKVAVSLSGFGVGDAISYTLKLTVLKIA